MADIFISYSREDRSVTEVLVRALEANDFSVWWDQNLGAGVHWGREIERQIRNSKAVLVIWSPKSIRSDWVREEAHLALNERKLVNAYTQQFSPEELPSGVRLVRPIEISDHAAIIAAMTDLIRRPTEEAFVVPDF